MTQFRYIVLFGSVSPVASFRLKKSPVVAPVMVIVPALAEAETAALALICAANADATLETTVSVAANEIDVPLSQYLEDVADFNGAANFQGRRRRVFSPARFCITSKNSVDSSRRSRS